MPFKNLLTIFLMICWLAANNLLAQPLIPRQELFDSRTKINIVLSGDGQTVYYLKVPRELSTIYAHHIVSRRTNKIQLPGRVRRFAAISAQAMVATVVNQGKEEVRLIANRKVSENLLSANAKRVRLKMIVGKGAVLLIQHAQRDSTGYYFLTADRSLKFILPFEGFQDVFTDAEGNPVAAQRRNTDGSFGLFLRKKNQWKPWIRFPWNEGHFLGGLQKIVSVSNNGKDVYFTDNRDVDKNQLKKYHISTGKTTTLLTPQKADILPFGMLLNGQNHQPAIMVSIFAQSQYHIVDPTYAKDLAYLRKAIPYDISFADQSWDGQQLLIRAFTGHTHRYYHYHRKTQLLTYLFTDKPHLEKYALSDRIFHQFTTSDGLNLPMHLYLPPGADQNQDGIPDTPLPTVIYIHGGPWVGIIHFNSWLHQRNYQLLANRGYAVIVAEFRGTTGLGKEITRRSYKKWGTDMTHDIAELADWAIAKKVAIKDKLGLWGWSYGGYSTLAGLAFYPKKYACGISMYGPPVLMPDSLLAGYNDITWHTRVGHPVKERAMLDKHSPINFAKNFQSPLLLTTGSKDHLIMQYSVDTMANRLHKAGKDITYFYYPKEGHDYRRKASWVSFWAHSEAFLQKHLGGKAEPVGNDLQNPGYVMVYPPKPALITYDRTIATYYMAELRPQKTGLKMGEKAKIQRKHMAYIQQLVKGKHLVLAGAFKKGGGLFFIKAKSLEEARQLIDQDPGVKAGLQKVTIREWFTERGLFTLENRK